MAVAQHFMATRTLTSAQRCRLAAKVETRLVLVLLASTAEAVVAVVAALARRLPLQEEQAAMALSSCNIERS